MKKTLALVLALAMVFSTITVAFAEGTIGADAQVCVDLAMLKGPTGTVDAAYLASVPNRAQAALMVLRLRGLEAEALAFTGTANFADADQVAWAKPVMAYLKANPQLGWAGDGTNFNPAAPMTAQAYYKVMLEALGYKQNTTEVVGDFAYADTLTFAAGKGLTKVAAVTNFTVNDLATATVETLKATVKGDSKTLVASLIEAGKVDKAKAVAANIFVDAAATTEANLDAAIATGNDKVEVTFDADAAKAFAENVANYKVVVKGSTTALEVKAAKAVSATIVELTTAAQTGGTAYTLTVGAVAKNFSGVAKNTGAPELDTVKCIDTNTIEIVLTKAMDRTSVEDVANYTLNNGATVEKAELWIDQDDSRKTVKLTTAGLVKNKIYKVKVANVKSADMVAIKTAEKSFAGTSDTTAPKISGNIVVKNNQRILVNFDDDHGMDEATLENVANWSIDGLVITSVVAVDAVTDNYNVFDQAEVNTEPMEAGKKYTVTMSNLIDGSYSKNAIAKALTKTFVAKAVDKTAPKAGQITVYSDNLVEIDFSGEANRLDAATATDINNYTFTEGLQVLSAKIIRASKPDNDLGKTVLLTTSTMDEDTTYKITIENVADEFGNVMTKVSNRSIARTNGFDIKPPSITRTDWVDLDTVKLTFDERLDEATAIDPANYVINKTLGAVVKAEISKSDAGNYKVVTLTTAAQAENTAYTVTINGLKDLSGNTTADYKAYFTSGMDGADTVRPEIENVTAISESEIWVTFDEPVVATAGAQLTIDVNDDDAIAGAIETWTVAGSEATDYTLDEGTTVAFVNNTANGLNKTDELTIFEITGIEDDHNNSFVVNSSDRPTVYGSETANDKAEVDTTEQVDVLTFKVTFSEPILLNGGGYTGTIADEDGNNWTATVDFDEEETTDALSTLTLESQFGVIPDGVNYVFDFSALLEDYTGVASSVWDEVQTTAGNTTIEALLEDEDDPMIDYVEAVNTTKIKVVYNEDIQLGAVGSYVIKDSEGDTVVSPAAARDGDYYNIVNLTIAAGDLEAGEVYTLVPKTSAKDLSENTSVIKDVEIDFVASSVVNNNYIKGVTIVDSKTIKVAVTKALNPAGADGLTVEVEDSDVDLVDTGLAVGHADPKLATVAGIKGNGTTTLTVYLNQPILDGVTYEVVTTGAVIADTFAFTGILGDGGLDVAADQQITFSGWDVDEYVVKVVYDTNGNGVISATEDVYYVTAEAATGEFVFDTLYDVDDQTALTYASLATGATYVVEVYRLKTDIDASATANFGAYVTAIEAAGWDDAVLYSLDVEK